MTICRNTFLPCHWQTGLHVLHTCQSQYLCFHQKGFLLQESLFQRNTLFYLMSLNFKVLSVWGSLDLLLADKGVKKKHYVSSWCLTLSQTMNFRLFQTERVCRRQFQILWKWQKVLLMGRKHCGKRRNCLFPAVFSKESYYRHVKNQGLFGKGLTHYQTTFYTGPNGNKLQTRFQTAFKMKNMCHIG